MVRFSGRRRSSPRGAAACAPARRIGAPISPSLYADLTWRCIGPFDGGPVASVEGVAGEPGVYVITTPSGGAWKTIDGGDTWTSIERPARAVPPADPHRWIDPANPRRIVATDAQGIDVSLDGGETWMASHHLPIAEVARLAPRAQPAEPAASRAQIAASRSPCRSPIRCAPDSIFAGTNDCGLRVVRQRRPLVIAAVEHAGASRSTTSTFAATIWWPRPRDVRSGSSTTFRRSGRSSAATRLGRGAPVQAGGRRGAIGRRPWLSTTTSARRQPARSRSRSSMPAGA